MNIKTVIAAISVIAISTTIALSCEEEPNDGDCMPNQPACTKTVNGTPTTGLCTKQSRGTTIGNPWRCVCV